MIRKTALVLGALLVASSASADEVVLKAISSFPRNYVFTRSFEKYIDKLNKEGAGVVQIKLIGGAEAIPPRQQPLALKNGVVDMLYEPPNFYLGQVPEGDAFSASQKTPMALRQNGGWDYVSKIYETKLNAKLLAWFDSGIGMHIFLTTEPKRTSSGGVDLTGVKLRSTPIFNQLFKSLGATNVSMPPAEIYTSLERGVIQGLGTPIITVLDFSWDKFVHYRVDPSFYQADVLTIVNLDKWRSLSSEAREILQRTAIAYEKELYEHWQAEQVKIRTKQSEKGIKPITLEGKAAEQYLGTAYGSSWQRMEKSTPQHAAQLKKYFAE